MTGVLLRGMGLCALIIAILTTGCGGSGDSAMLRILNASPGETGLDVTLDTKSLSSNVTYGSPTNYISVNTGAQEELKMSPTGTSTPVIDEMLNIAGGSHSTVIATNFPGNISAMLLTDDTTAPGSGNAKLRVVNISPSLGTVDVFVVPPWHRSADRASGFVEFDLSIASTYGSIAAGTYQVLFTTPGSAFVIFDAGTLTLNAGQNRTYAVMNGAAGGFSSLTLNDLN